MWKIIKRIRIKESNNRQKEINRRLHYTQNK